MLTEEIEKEAREYRGELKDPAITEAYIAGRTKSEEEKSEQKQFYEACIQEIKNKYATLRNSTIEECLKQCEFLADEGMLYVDHIKRRLNALKK